MAVKEGEKEDRDFVVEVRIHCPNGLGQVVEKYARAGVKAAEELLDLGKSALQNKRETGKQLSRIKVK